VILIRHGALCAALALGGCIPYGKADSPADPYEVPSSYAALEMDPSNSSRRTQVDQAWWVTFNDPELTQLEEHALAGNFSLSAAWARLEQAETVGRQIASARYPQIMPEGSALYQRTAGFLRESIAFRASVPVTYEVDWFARYKGEAEAARFDARAARADVESAAMTVAANVAETWYDLVEARARREILEDQLELNGTFLELTQLRFRQGLTSALDVHQQRQQVATIRAQLDVIRAQERIVSNQLVALLGGLPAETGVPERAELPELPPLPDPGIPATLLESRPDIRAAMRRIQAADRRVASAVAAHLPSLVLSGAAGYAWNRFQFVSGDGLGPPPPPGEEEATGPVTVHGVEYSAGANLVIPLFDGFLRKARIDENRARLREATASYAETLQQAMVEVENAVAQEQEQLKRIENLEEQVAAATDALEAARDRYQQGLVDFLNVLTALQGQRQAEVALLEARRQVLSARIQLHRALGGTWTQDLEPHGALPTLEKYAGLP
jgi:outer membrane protein, multidrug efflux system